MPSGIYKRTEIHKKHISDALTGRTLSREHARKMGLTKIGNKNMLGKHHSISSKKELSLAHIGKKLTLEHRKKIGLASKGRPGGMLGKKHKLETRKKMSLAHRREKHHFWRGGISSLRKAIRNTFEYKKWRTNGFERDKYMCVIGGKKHGNKLNFDHIKSFSDIMIENNIKSVEESLLCKEFWDINNGRTLCEKCHRKTDTWGMRKKHEIIK